MSNSMTINDVDLGGENYGFVVEANSFLDTPQPRVNRDRLASADGEVLQGSTFDARTGVVSGVVHASNYENLIVQFNNLAGALLVTQEGTKVVTFDARPGVQFRCRVLNTSWSNETACTMDLAITLVAPNPWAEASEATEGSGNNDGSGGTTL